MSASIVRRVFLSGVIIAVAGNIANAETLNHETRFSVRFTGIVIGRATFKISFDDSSYSLEGSGKTSGLVEWMAPASGTVKSSGILLENALKPKTHKASVFEKRKKPESVLLSFSDHAVANVKFETVKKKKPRIAPKYVPVETRHMAAVIDPASSLIVPLSGEDAKDGAKVCNQKFPIFDGETRYDIKLSYKSTKPIKTDGYDGHVYVCKMRYVPVAGHKKNHRSVREMAANKNMEIWLAPMQGVSVFTPIKIFVGTKYGNFTALPTYFGKAG